MRGKAAAQAANRRAAEAQDRVTALETQLREQEQRHREELREARQERDRARDRLTREVDARARQAIADAQLVAAAEMARVREECHGRILDGFALICRNLGGEVPIKTGRGGSHGAHVSAELAELGEAFGVSVGDLLAAVKPDVGRRIRRRTNRGTRELAERYRKAAVHQ